jgi:macrolide-specific efflux system membrane fusion protein
VTTVTPEAGPIEPAQAIASPTLSSPRNPRRRRRVVVIILIAVGIIALAVGLIGRPPTPSGTGLATETVSQGDVTLSVDASGQVFDEYTIAVAPETTPVLVEKAGVTVGTGTMANGYTTATIEVAVGDAVSAGQQLGTATNSDGTQYAITTPSAGHVRSITTAVGASASQFATIGIGSTVLATQVSENDVVQLKKDQAAAIVLGSGGSAFAGKVSTIAQSSTTASGVQKYLVLITTDKLPSAARIGMTATVTVTIDSKTGVLNVSPSALTTVGPLTTVTVIDSKGNAVVTPVTLGLVGTSRVEVVSGLKAGDRVSTGSTGSVPTVTSNFPGPAGQGPQGVSQ